MDIATRIANRIAIRIAAVLLFLAPAYAVSAATYQVDFSGGGGTVIGTFDAPLAGGNVSNFMVALSGVTFDTSTGVVTTFTYNPVINEFEYTSPGPFPSFTNSVNTPLCAAGGCFLEIYPDPTPGVPGDYLAIDALLNNIDAGTKYIIDPNPVMSPVPLPASVPLLAAGLVLLGWLGRRKKT